MHRYAAVVIALVHVYLSFGHLSELFGGDLQWTHFWKGFGSLGGAYVFAALATRGFAREIERPRIDEKPFLFGQGGA